jgi:cytochrome c-type biogenesis protein CcmH
MRVKLIVITVLACIFSASGWAQDTPIIPDNIDTSNISDDAVNAIAHQLYCPVCENIPLDTCGTVACEDWRNEIRGMLATGMSEAAIIDNFVVRFGDRVVGTPRDPVIAAISIITPWLVVILGVAVGLYTLMQWQRKSKDEKQVAAPVIPEKSKRDSYLEQLEKDLAG